MWSFLLSTCSSNRILYLSNLGKNYRITNIKLNLLRELLQTYQGTHNFHNFTKYQTYGMANSKRHIRSFIAKDPIIVHNFQCIPLTVVGDR